MTLITWYLTEGCFYSDLAVIHVEGLTTPWPHLGTFLPIGGRFYVWVLLHGSATAQGVTFWERICLPLVPCTWLPWAWPSPWVVSVPKASLGRQGYFTSQAALLWCYHYGLEATFNFSLSLPRIIGNWGLRTASLPPWSFLPMGIREPHCDCLDLMIFDLGDALVGWRLHLGDALPWRRLFLMTLALSVSSPMRRLVLTLTSGVDFDLDLVNARVRDGTILLLYNFILFIVNNYIYIY